MNPLGILGTYLKRNTHLVLEIDSDEGGPWQWLLSEYDPNALYDDYGRQLKTVYVGLGDTLSEALDALLKNIGLLPSERPPYFDGK